MITSFSKVGRLALATVASDSFRVLNRNNILRELESAPVRELAWTLATSHLAGLFITTFGALLRDEVRNELRCLVRTQQVRTDALIELISEVQRSTPGLSAGPVLLKGPSLWGWLYLDATSRRTRDIDLIISDRDDLLRIVSTLHNLGFSGDFAAIHKAIDLRDHYELPTMTKEIIVPADDRDVDFARQALEHYPARTDIQISGQDSISFTAEIELHKSIFLFNDGTYPEIIASAVTHHEWFPGLHRLRAEAQLPYIAAKFGMDVNSSSGAPPQAQAMKLLADFVRLLERASPQEFAASLEISKAWCCDEFYGRMIATAAPLLPEIEFARLAHEPYPLHAILTVAAQ